MQDFTITTLGCKVNQYDSSAIAKALQQAGLRNANRGQMTDLIVINTCCVTTVAMRKSRQTIRNALRKSPDATIIIAGCYATYHENRLRELLDDMDIPAERRLIVGHHDDIAEELSAFLIKQSARPIRTEIFKKKSTDMPGLQSKAVNHQASGTKLPKTKKIPATMQTRRIDAVDQQAPGAYHLPSIDNFPGHQRAFVKIQDGCDAFCSYCIVCYTRPRVTSRPIDEIRAECAALVEAGHREIVLCGVFLGAFSRDTAIRKRWPADQPSQLPKLLQTIADIPGLWRVRLSSLEPGDLNDELLDVAASHPAVAPHFHLPLQSGSREILKRMNRQYTPDEFRQTVDHLQTRLDRPAITTDIIVGFPGEGESEFAETLTIARHAGFAKIHAFPFSAIEPTAAWRYRQETPPAEVLRERLARLNALEQELAKKYREQFIGFELEGLVESTIPQPDLRQAMTDRYLTVTFPNPYNTTRPDANSNSSDNIPMATPQTTRCCHATHHCRPSSPQKTDVIPAKAGNHGVCDTPPDLTGQVVNLKITSATDTGLAGICCNVKITGP